MLPRRIDAIEPEVAEFQRIDEHIDRANRIALVNPIIEAFRQQRRLLAIRPLNKTLHHFPRRFSKEIIASMGFEPWMKQIARNVTMEGCGALRDCRYLLHDRDTKYTHSFRAIIASAQVEPLVLPARSPNLNAYAERWVRSVKEECLCKVILIGERSLRRALNEYVQHYHAERNHQGKGNVLLFPWGANIRRDRPVQCRERMGGLLRYYHQEAA
jgi:Integrase core domain